MFGGQKSGSRSGLSGALYLVPFDVLRATELLRQQKKALAGLRQPN
ncbi:hypothetical protein L0Z02_19905 [Burkholderia multivorans]|nr:hypothetical protein [Burkholderia multivorans]MCO1455457.1 hypothetical protein [Burkholderia multivorans]MCO1470009.1 hypothetical protein [Burkholderia multivorans]UQO20346.1 hypothetical protein L0Z02_19905 [Burkholderia multivorans]